MRAVLLPLWSRRWCWLALVLALATSSAAALEPPDSPSPSPSGTDSSPSATPNWDEFDRMLSELETQAHASTLDWETQSQMLKALRTEAEKWKSSSEDYAMRLEALEVSTRAADAAAARALGAAVLERDIWRTAGLAGLGALAGAMVDDRRGALVGAGLGAAGGLLWRIWGCP